MSDLETAAQQALKALEQCGLDDSARDYGKEAAAITALKAALEEPVQEPVAWRYKPMIGSPWSLSDDGYYISCKRDKGYIVEPLYTALRDALAEPQQDHELSAALGWVAGISEPLLDRKSLLRRVAELAQDTQAKTKRAWDVGYDCGIRAAKEFAAERRLTDAEIGQLWFEAKLPGVTETQARLLIRAAERRLLEGE